MSIINHTKIVLIHTVMFCAMTSVSVYQQWNGPANLNGTIWRSGNVALGLEPSTGSDSPALLEIRRPMSDSDPLLLSAIATFQNAMGPVFEVDTRRAYAGGAREKAAVLPSGAYDIATYGGVAFGLVNLNERIPSDYMLAVDGKVLAEEVRIKLVKDWADYVFRPDYPLQSLPRT